MTPVDLERLFAVLVRARLGLGNVMIDDDRGQSEARIPQSSNAGVPSGGVRHGFSPRPYKRASDACWPRSRSAIAPAASPRSGHAH